MSLKLPYAVEFLTIEVSQEGQRLDNFLLTYLKGVPKSRIYRLIRKGEVRVNKHRIKPDYRIQAADIIRIPPIVRLDKSDESIIIPEGLKRQIKETILLDNSSVLVINKPTKLAVHGGSGLKFGLIDIVRQLSPELLTAELVHRLDRDTSGCLMLATSYQSLTFLHEQLKNHSILKEYWCLVHGSWPDDLSEVSFPLHKFMLKSGERLVIADSDKGKDALTKFVVRKRLGDDFTILSAFPITGRTHQIRVHAKESGFPIVGDVKYGDAVLDQNLKKSGLNRLCLHASKLQFMMDCGKKQVVEASLPEELEQLIARLRS